MGESIPPQTAFRLEKYKRKQWQQCRKLILHQQNSWYGDFFYDSFCELKCWQCHHKTDFPCLACQQSELEARQFRMQLLYFFNLIFIFFQTFASNNRTVSQDRHLVLQRVLIKERSRVINAPQLWLLKSGGISVIQF